MAAEQRETEEMKARAERGESRMGKEAGPYNAKG